MCGVGTFYGEFLLLEYLRIHVYSSPHNSTFADKKDEESRKQGSFLTSSISDTHPIDTETAASGLFFMSCLPASVS